MSPTSKNRAQLTSIFLFAMILIYGIYLRLVDLYSVPYGLDSDQTRVILTGLRAWAEGGFRVYAEEGTRFEALASYLFAPFEIFLGNARVLSFLFSIADIGLLMWLLRRRGVDWALVMGGAALLASSPMAIYYARVAGPCVGASTILLAFFLARGIWTRTAWLTLGLFYYSILRLLFVYELFAAAVRRDGPRALRASLAAVVLVLGSMLAGDLGLDAKLRGGYNFDLSPSELVTRIGEGLRLWMGPPSDRMVTPDQHLVLDPVSNGMAWVIGSAPAMGIGFAMLAILSLLQFAQDLFTAGRRDGYWKALKALRAEIKFFLFAAAALMLSPTYSHAIFLAPMAVFFVITSFQNVSLRHSGVRLALLASLVISGWAGTVQSARIWQNLKEPGQFDIVFRDRMRWLFENRVLKEERKVTFYTTDSYDVARYWALKGSVAVFPPIDPDMAVNSLRLSSNGETQVVYFDVQKLTATWLDHPVAVENRAKQKEIENLITGRAQIESREEITVMGEVVAHRYVLRFR